MNQREDLPAQALRKTIESLQRTEKRLKALSEAVISQEARSEYSTAADALREQLHILRR